jgi:hypothetical protein
MGVIGVPLGTAIGQIVSFAICIYLARKKIGKEITSFLRFVRYLPALVALAVAGICEWSLHDRLPSGGIGLILSGLLTLPAFLIYYGWVYRELLRQRFRIPAVAGQRRGLDRQYGLPESQMAGLQMLLSLASQPTAEPSYSPRLQPERDRARAAVDHQHQPGASGATEQLPTE